MLPTLSIIVPCYNEAKNIPFIVAAFIEIIETNSAVEIIFVNNGSTDDSAVVFEQQLQKYTYPNFKLVTVKVNQGYGYGILEGLKNATAPILSWTHADLQTDPKDVLKALRLYLLQPQQNLLIKGTRRKRNFVDAFFTWGMQVYSNYKLSVRLNDINAQPKLFSRQFR
jgi:glycosyltransferase involved in cell wall biosynthesis